MADEAYELVLTRKAVDGDSAALTVLLTLARDRLHAHVARRIPADLRGTIDADDVLQEALVEAYGHIGGFEPRGSDSFSLIHRIASDVGTPPTEGVGWSVATRSSMWVGRARTPVMGVWRWMTFRSSRIRGRVGK